MPELIKIGMCKPLDLRWGQSYAHEGVWTGHGHGLERRRILAEQFHHALVKEEAEVRAENNIRECMVVRVFREAITKRDGERREIYGGAG